MNYYYIQYYLIVMFHTIFGSEKGCGGWMDGRWKERKGNGGLVENGLMDGQRTEGESIYRTGCVEKY